MTQSMFIYELLSSELFPKSGEQIRENVKQTESGFETRFAFGVRVEYNNDNKSWRISLNGFKGEAKSLIDADKALIKDAEDYYK
jgi:hypothetical protein